MNFKVIYEDNHVIVVDKKAGIPVQADDSHDVSLQQELQQYLKLKYNKPGNVFLAIVQRLDRPVSGLIVFAKNSKAAARISEQIREHKINKKYQAIVIGAPKNENDELIHYLIKDKKKNKVSLYDEPVKDSLEAKLAYRVRQTNHKYSLIEVELITGRSHQIRSQLSAIGCPILGDLKYGSPKPLPDKSIALKSVSLSFNDIVTKEPKELKIDGLNFEKTIEFYENQK